LPAASLKFNIETKEVDATTATPVVKPDKRLNEKILSQILEEEGGP